MVAVVTEGAQGAPHGERRRRAADLFRPLAEGTLERRVVDAYTACLDRWGLDKTTMADVAREAGVSRATVYRVVPGGKVALHELHRRHAMATFFTDLDAAIPVDADLGDQLTRILVAASRALADDEGFQRRLVDDPGAVLPGVTFRGLDRVFAACRVFVAPRLTAHLDPATATRAAEWLARLVLWPVLDERAPFDLTDPDEARALVERRLLPTLARTTPITHGDDHP